MLDPVLKLDQPQPVLLQALLKDWGIDASNDVVLDVSGMGRLIGTDESVPVAAAYPSHSITQDFGLLTAYPLARSMAPIAGGVNGRTAQKLVETGPRSWAESDLKSLTGGEAAKADDSDKKGPITLASAVSGPATNAPAPKEPPAPGETPKQVEARIVAFGDSDFASNAALGVQGNRDLFLNTVELAGAAGKPDLDPAEGSRRSPDHADRGAGAADLLPHCADHPGPDSPGRRADLVAEALT